MHFLSPTWTLLIGFVMFVLSLAISARKPSGAQMLLMALGAGDARDWLEGWAVGLHGGGGAAREARAGGRWRGWVRRWWGR